VSCRGRRQVRRATIPLPRRLRRSRSGLHICQRSCEEGRVGKELLTVQSRYHSVLDHDCGVVVEMCLGPNLLPFTQSSCLEESGSVGCFCTAIKRLRVWSQLPNRESDDNAEGLRRSRTAELHNLDRSQRTCHQSETSIPIMTTSCDCFFASYYDLINYQ
jgi:hypothetical protein